MRGMTRLLLAFLVTTAVACGPVKAPAPEKPTGTKAPRQFTYTWRYDADDESAAPRGGTSHGPAVTLATKPGLEWERLRAPGLTALERDRRAILAMAGTFRTSFDFLEVAGFRPEFEPDRPYQSWGTEYVAVVRDEPRFISLQHLLVMFMKHDGKVAGPFVTKHWRQDWRYEDDEMLTYRGRLTWGRERLPRAAARGTWTQAVFQVDDSPRYEAAGRWEHFGNVSTWRSGTTWRPLPRREWSVRKDYDVLIGTNAVTITPTGWIYEESNLKTALDAAGRPSGAAPVLAKEIGFNRFERVVDFDDAAGRRYQERTAPFWAEVRAAWAEIARTRPTFTLRASPDQAQLFMPLFEYAEKLDEGTPYDAAAARAFARQTVATYLAPADAPAPAAAR
jgi:hypothetical protein